MNVVARQGGTATAGFARRGAASTTAGALVLAPAIVGAVFGGPGFALLAAIALLGALATADGRAALLGLTGLALPALGFLAGLAAMLVALTPFAPGGVHPLWGPIGPGAAVLDREAAVDGALTLCGLAMVFLLATVFGARSDRARQAVRALAWATWAEAVALAIGGWAGVAAPSGLCATIAGLAVLLQLSSALQTWKVERPRRWLGRLRTAPWALAAAVIALALTGLCGGWTALTATVCAAVLLTAWDALDTAGEGRMRREPLLIVLGLLGIAVAAVALSLITALSAPNASVQAVSNGVHWRAFLASPWLGYGPGSAKAVAMLSMDRLSMPALQAAPAPGYAYLAALEQVGTLGVVALVAAVAAAVAILIDASVRRRRLTGLYRLAVTAVGFYALAALISPAPFTPAGAAPVIVLLGCGFGAARAGR